MADTEPVLYRRSAHVVFYWRDGRLIAHNYATGTNVAAQPVVCEILHFFDEWRAVDEWFATRPRHERRLVLALLSLLVKRSLMQRSDRPASGSERQMETWRDWNPAAGFFHNTTKDLAYGDLATIERLTRKKSRVVPMPPSVKRYAAAPVVALPRVDARGEFPEALLARRTWRRFGKQPIELADFSLLLGLTAAVQSWASASDGQRVALKTSPSGGARHSIEVYAAAINVRGLRRGLYHYACDSHVLERIGSTRRVQAYLPTQWWYDGASAMVFFCAVFERVQWRYEHARAYRAALIEAGHLCQTFCLTATWRGLAPFCSMALADSRIERDLRIDGITESVLYAAGVGTRPATADWVAASTVGTPPALLPRKQYRRFPGRLLRRRS